MTRPKIWVIGNANTNADKEIPWESTTLPHIADADILIIDLTTLNRKIFEKMDGDVYHQIKQNIRDKFVHSGQIFFITTKKFECVESVGNEQFEYSNFDFIPIEVTSHSISKGYDLVFEGHSLESNPHRSYFEKVKNFDFYLENFDLSEIRDELPANKKVTSFKNRNVTDKSGHIISKVYAVKEDEKNLGRLTLLPPPTTIPVNEAINLIIENFSIEEKEMGDNPPPWIENIVVSGVDERMGVLRQMQSKKESIENEIRTTESQIENLLKYRKLLYSNGKSLEVAVFEAFKLLGFDDIKQIRETDLEDWIFEFKNISDYQYGIIEVKGSEKRTSLSNLTQCNKWIEDYLLEGKSAKGIFVTNQNRMKEYPSSLEDRLHFEPNELDYATKREICIIPSCVLFEAVNNTLKVKQKTRSELEEIFSKTNGLLKQI